MWICLKDSFLSIVAKDCAPDELLVRARRPGDIERLWPDAAVREGGGTDYRFRAAIPRAKVAAAIADALTGINYGNFKNEVDDPALHDAYLDVWHALARLQPYGRR
jgi:hypothetical protein